MKRLPLILTLVVLGAPMLSAPFLSAQDTRNVLEPTIPLACITLDAQLTATSHDLAPADETRLDTTRIQQALDGCAQTQAVVLRAHGSANAFLSGPLNLRAGVTLVVDKGVTLFGSRDPSVYETSPGSCGIVTDTGSGCKPLLSAQHIAGSGIMGEGTIDGRGGARLLGRNVSWWDLAEQARPNRRQQVPRLLVTDYADDFTLYRITLKNSPNFHVVYNHGDGFTVWGLKIDTPKRLVRNTDGVDPGSGSKNITITHSFIRTGDDNVAIKGGPGGVTNMTVSHNHFYYGHGMSIGSETNGGVSAIRVIDLSLDGPDNGIRIKSNGSRGGLVHDILYDDICIRDSANPITLDTGYTAAGTLKGDHPPTMRDVTLRNVRVSGGGKITFNGYDPTHRVALTLDNVLLAGPAPYKYTLAHADLHLGPGPTNLQLPLGEDSTIQGIPTRGSAASCSEKFVPFPQ